MESFILNKNKSSILFSLEKPDSILYIKTITLITQEELSNTLSNFVSSIRLSYELIYTVFNDKESGFIEERKQNSPIIIPVDLVQTQPIFVIEQKIMNEKFTVGVNPVQHWFTALKLEITNANSINQQFELKFDVELLHIKEENVN